MSSFRLSWTYVLAGLCLLAVGLSDGMAQTVIFSDDFDPADCSNPTLCGTVYSCGGSVDGNVWQKIPGKINGYGSNKLIGSEACHQKNHTGSTDGSMSDVSAGGSAREVPANPYVYGTFYDFSASTHVLTGYWNYDLNLSGWVWDDVEYPLCNAYPVRMGGGIGITAAPGDAVLSTKSCGGGSGQNEIYPYDDYAFLGIESASVSTDAESNYYKWRTKADESSDGSVKWHLAIDPDTSAGIPRRTNLVCPHTGAQTWRHLQIVVHPYTGNLGDIEFYIDGVLVGQGHRSASADCKGVDFQRIQLGARFPEQSDIDLCKPPYSYEGLWFDDVSLTATPGPLPCVNTELRFDSDGDGDIDMVDFAAFQRCYTSSLSTDCSCRCMNSDGSDTIDATDLNAFINCASGAALPADPDCESGLTPP